MKIIRFNKYVSLVLSYIISISASGQDSEHPHVNTSIYSILKYDKMIDIAMYVKFNRPYATSLSSSEIDEMETLVDSSCQAFYRENSRLKMIVPLSTYRRQYVAVINAKGQKEVWLNLLYSPAIKNWKHQIVIVDDGGTCYFQLKINLSLKKAYGLIPNSVA